MPSVILIDGVVTPRALATVSIFDRGFLYGDTVFETLRVYRGEPFLLVDHVARLRASTILVGLELVLTDAELGAEVRAAVLASGEGEAVVRLTLTRGEGPPGIDPRGAVCARRFVQVEPLADRLGVVASGPIAVQLVAARRGADLAPTAKIGAYVDAILALRRAHAAGADDAVLVDPGGCLLEATTSNVFVVTADGRLVTPATGSIFPGLTRRETLAIAGEMGLSPCEGPVEADELRGAAEAFLTSSVREIVPISRVDGVLLPTAAPGPVTSALGKAYRARVPGGL